jgi:hypothetical protein
MNIKCWWHNIGTGKPKYSDKKLSEVPRVLTQGPH